MRTILVVFAFALLTIAACGGTESTNADTSLTIDQIIGIWKIDAIDILKDTCEFPGMMADFEARVGTYNYIEKADESHVNTYNCGTDATCATKTEKQTFVYSKGTITVPAEDNELINMGGCRAYVDAPDTYTVILSSASAASMLMSGVTMFEGACDALKAENAGDDEHPDKTFGDYEGCQVQAKQITSKQ